jgi:hypothetical protein
MQDESRQAAPQLERAYSSGLPEALGSIRNRSELMNDLVANHYNETSFP